MVNSRRVKCGRWGYSYPHYAHYHYIVTMSCGKVTSELGVVQGDLLATYARVMPIYVSMQWRIVRIKRTWAYSYVSRETSHISIIYAKLIHLHYLDHVKLVAFSVPNYVNPLKCIIYAKFATCNRRTRVPFIRTVWHRCRIWHICHSTLLVYDSYVIVYMTYHSGTYVARLIMNDTNVVVWHVNATFMSCMTKGSCV